MLAAGRQTAQIVSHHFYEQSFMTVLVGFVLGYVTVLLINGRR